jgi:hypothetical protein
VLRGASWDCDASVALVVELATDGMLRLLALEWLSVSALVSGGCSFSAVGVCCAFDEVEMLARIGDGPGGHRPSGASAASERSEQGRRPGRQQHALVLPPDLLGFSEDVVRRCIAAECFEVRRSHPRRFSGVTWTAERIGKPALVCARCGSCWLWVKGRALDVESNDLVLHARHYRVSFLCLCVRFANPIAKHEPLAIM